MNNFMNHDFNVKKIILACFVAAGTGDAVHRGRPSHGLAMHLRGEKKYIFSTGKTLTVKANDIIYLPKNSSYSVSSVVSGDCYAINFEIDEDVNFEPFVVGAKNHSGILEHFRSANAIWNLKKKSYMLKCKAELYNIIYAIHSEYFSDYVPKNKLDIIAPAIDYIHENYTGNTISIEKLSAMCGITSEYFRRIFKSFFGTTPINYINNLKITMARELLESQMYSVTDAALKSGYSEMSHFSREFKKTTGLSPSEYMKDGLNDQH